MRSCRRMVVAVAVLLVVPASARAEELPYAAVVDATAQRHGVDVMLVHAIIAVESAHNMRAVSPTGAAGLMQLMPATQRAYGVSDPFNPRENVEAGVVYLRRLVDEFGTVLAVAAYNAGPGVVRRYRGIPPFAETRAYVRAVLRTLTQLRAGYGPAKRPGH